MLDGIFAVYFIIFLAIYQTKQQYQDDLAQWQLVVVHVWLCFGMLVRHPPRGAAPRRSHLPWQKIARPGAGCLLAIAGEHRRAPALHAPVREGGGARGEGAPGLVSRRKCIKLVASRFVAIPPTCNDNTCRRRGTLRASAASATTSLACGRASWE